MQRAWFVPTFAVLVLSGCVAAQHGLPALFGSPPLEELVIELDPLDLSAGATHVEAVQPEPLWSVFPRDAWMHGYALEIVDAEGDRVPAEILHHIKLLVPGERELFAPIMLRLVGAGAESRGGRLPHTLGFPLQAGDSLLVTAMVHNPTAADLHGVRLRLRLLYTATDRRGPATVVYPFFMHVTQPGEHSGYDLPPGRSERSWESTAEVAGRIIVLGGHLHRYGTELRLEDATTGRLLWRTRARLDGEGNVLEVPHSMFKWSRGIPLRAGHRYRVTAVYVNPTGETIADGGMGTVGGIILPAGSWPRVNRDDPLYAADLKQETAAGHDHHHSHH